MSRRWQTALALTISIVLLYWALHDVSLVAVWGHVRAANIWLLLLAISIQTSMFLIRAVRWRVFLRPALAEVSLNARFVATCIGFMANNLLPARVGEFARAYSLSRTQPIRVGASFGSLVVERVFDGFVLAIFLTAPLLVPRLAGGGGFADVSGAAITALLIFSAAVVVLLILIGRPHLAVRAFRVTLGRLLPPRGAERIGEIMYSFIAGLGALRRPGLVGAGLVWSIVLWAWGGLAYLLGLLAFGIDAPGYSGAIFLQSVNAFAVAIPSSPGFFGPFEASVRLALSPFGVTSTHAFSFAVAFHIGTFLPITLIGLYYVWRSGLTWGEVEHSEELVEEAEDEEGVVSAGPGREAP